MASYFNLKVSKGEAFKCWLGCIFWATCGLQYPSGWLNSEKGSILKSITTVLIFHDTERTRAIVPN